MLGYRATLPGRQIGASPEPIQFVVIVNFSSMERLSGEKEPHAQIVVIVAFDGWQVLIQFV
ncbi:hypothetical protein KDK_51810 [Dictyobacter kobayashii]|uniref:Uncharacterized protein n=1 Tax=Dictyobacter kobayashii TaxID=2014872 RepID=A0A402AQD0_9CHLR|nr:hypothetical protein KDK_51810 [Dictyobacter kobayashii]